MESSSGVNKSVLFFSNYCTYSRSVLNMLTKKSLRSLFILICVDGLNNVPKFVDRVPLIYTHLGESITDNDIEPFMDRIQADAFPRSVEPMMCSDGFCDFQGIDSIDDDMNGGQQTVASTNHYMSVSQMDAYSITTPKEDDFRAKRSDSSVLEKFIAQRDNEYNLLKTQVQRT